MSGQVASDEVWPVPPSALIGAAGCAGNSSRMSRHKEALSIPGMSPFVGASQSSNTEAFSANSAPVWADASIIACAAFRAGGRFLWSELAVAFSRRAGSVAGDF